MNECCGGCNVEMPMFAEIGHEIPDTEVEAFHNEEVKKLNSQITAVNGSFSFLSCRLYVCLPNRARNGGQLCGDSEGSVARCRQFQQTQCLFIRLGTILRSHQKIKFPMLADTRHSFICLAHIFQRKDSLRGTFVVDRWNPSHCRSKRQ